MTREERALDYIDSQIEYHQRPGNPPLPPAPPDTLLNLITKQLGLPPKKGRALWASRIAGLEPAPVILPPEDVMSVASSVGVDGDDATPRERRANVLSVADLRALCPPTWDLENWLARGGITLLVGPSGSSKTFAAAALAGAVASGRPCFAGRAARCGPVVAVIGEDVSGWRTRFLAWCEAAGIDEATQDRLPLTTVIATVNLFDGTGFDLLLETIATVNPVLVLVDPLADLTEGANENSAQDMGIVRGRVRQLCGRGQRTVVIVHHTGHDESRERGSTALRALADVQILLRNVEGRVVASSKKVRNGPAFESVNLVLDADALVLRSGGSEGGTVSDRLLDALVVGPELVGRVAEAIGVSVDTVERIVRRKAHLFRRWRDADGVWVARKEDEA